MTDRRALAIESDTILSSALTGFRDLVGELGGSAAALLAAQGIAADALGRPAVKLPLPAFARLLEHAAATLGCPDFGMRLSEQQDGTRLSSYLTGLYRTAPTLLEAIRHTTPYNHAYLSGIRVVAEWLSEYDCYIQRYEIVNDEVAPFPQMIEWLMLLTQRACIDLSKGHARAHCILFAHRPIAPLPVYRRKFGTIAKFKQAYSGLLFSEQSFTLRLGDADDAFRQQLTRVSAEVPQRVDDAVQRIRGAIQARLSENCTRTQVCASLDLSVRTATRRLNEAGYSFQSLRDEIRRNLALRYLAITDLSMSEIAAELGYQEQAALTHSCRRWFGTTPLAQRRRLRREGGLSGDPTATGANPHP